MRKIIFTSAFLFASFFIKAQTHSNPMLTPDFWKQKPDIELVMNQIVKGHSASEANRGNHDVVSFAINNDAPLETILFLISQEGNGIDKITHDGRIYLHWAASRGNLELVQYLIKQGSDINRTDDKGATPLSFAAGFSQANTAIYDEFFKAGINPKQKYKDGASLIHLSVAGDKDLKISEYFISKGLDINDKDDFGRTVFDYAARGGNIELLKNLLEKGINPTPNALVIAAQGSRWNTNNIDVFRFLIEDLGLPADAKGTEGENALHYLVAKRDDQSENIRYFLDKGVDINAADNKGTSAFAQTTSTSNTELVEKLLPLVKDINARNKGGEIPLVFAVRGGTSEMVNLLLENGADPNIQTEDGNLAFHLVQSYRPARPGENSDDFSKKLQLLSDNKVDFISPQQDGNTLYHIAVNKNDIYLFKKLEPLNIDVNVVNKEGLTALHRAALVAKDDKLLKHLLALGARKDILTEFEESAYEIASENESLIESGIDISFLK